MYKLPPCIARTHYARSLTVQPYSLKGQVVCGTIYGDMHLKRCPGINRKSRVLYPGPGFLTSATWPSLPKKLNNGLINQSIILDFINDKTI